MDNLLEVTDGEDCQVALMFRTGLFGRMRGRNRPNPIAVVDVANQVCAQDLAAKLVALPGSEDCQAAFMRRNLL